jgi:methylmalonyl-CoA/ethylmalonyl-CoA epimerase
LQTGIFQSREHRDRADPALRGKSSWQDVLDEKGEGVHHIAFRVTDTAGKAESLAAQGIPLLHQGGDPRTGQFSYFDARETLGILVETLEGYDKS